MMVLHYISDEYGPQLVFPIREHSNYKEQSKVNKGFLQSEVLFKELCQFFTEYAPLIWLIFIQVANHHAMEAKNEQFTFNENR